MKELIYNLLDMASFGRGLKRTINGHQLRLPTRYFKYFPSTYEAENFEFLTNNCKPGAVIIDIGAHIGLFSVIASQVTGATGKVYAFRTYADITNQTFRLKYTGLQCPPFVDLCYNFYPGETKKIILYAF